VNKKQTCRLLVLSLVLFTITGTIASAQLAVTNTAPNDDPQYLVQSILLSSGITVSNVTFNGSPAIPTGNVANMIGYFNGVSSNIGITDGVILNTGSIFDAPGPNNSTNDGFDCGAPGDPDLNLLAANAPNGTYNAAVLEFDFETVTDGISFRYVFASEEYNEYVCSAFNDVFGFFISGPGISGPFSGGAENIALVPSTSDYVGINTVNNGSVGFAGSVNGCGGPGDPGLLNSTFFVDNEALGAQSVQYDGFTTVLTAQKALTPCETYHIKIAVADANDEIYDSGVFLEAASFGAVGIQVQVGEVGASQATLIEGCDSMIFTFSRPGDNSAPLTIYFNITGSATNGVDYTNFPDSIVIPAGASSINVVIYGFLDGLTEGMENIIITIPANLSNSTCIDDVPSVATVIIVDTEPMTLNISNDTMICPGDYVQLSSSVTGGIAPYTYSWTPTNNLTCASCSDPIASPSTSTTYTLSVTDECETMTLTEDITITVGGLFLTTGSGNLSIEGCQDGTFTFTRIGSDSMDVTIYFSIGGSAINGADYSTIADSIVIPAGQSSVDLVISPILDTLSETTETVVIITFPDSSGAFCSDLGSLTATVLIQNVDPIIVTASDDTLICGGLDATIYATAAGGVSPLSYSWDDGTTVVSTTQSATIAPLVQTTYTVTVSDACGNPSDSDQVVVTTTNPPPAIYTITDTAYEGCRNALFTIMRSDTSSDPITITFAISGTADNGTDYVTITNTVLLGAGQSSVDLIVDAFQDSILEGDETIIITLPRDSTDSVCYSIPFTATITIKNVAPVTLSVSDADICFGDSVTLVANASGGIGPLQYTWSSGSITSTITVAPISATNYAVTVVDTCGNDISKNNILVDVSDPVGSVLGAGAPAYEGCYNTTFSFYLPAALNYDYVVKFEISGTADNGQDYNTITDSVVIPAGDLSVDVQIDPLFDGIDEGAESVIINVIPNTTDTLCEHVFTSAVEIQDVDSVQVQTAGDTTVCNWEVFISAQATGGMGALTYSWTNGAGNSNTSIVKPKDTTTYILTVSDSCGTSTAYGSVTIDIDCEYLFFIPNAFTPNTDGLNDFFNGIGKGVKTYKMYVYNRWGDMIFESSDKYTGWDGTGNGGEKLSQQEVYVYIFEITDFLDIEHYYVGKVTLIR